MIEPSRRFVVETAPLYRTHSGKPVGAAVIFKRGRHLEKVKTPEHSPVHRRYDRSFANNLRVDAEQNSDGVRSDKPGHESGRPSEPFPVIVLDR